MKHLRRRIKRLLLALGIVLAALLLLFFAFTLTLGAGGFNRPLLKFALARANAQLDGRLSVADMDGNPLRHFVLKDLRLEDSSGAVVAEAPHMDVRWSPWHLFFFRSGFRVSVDSASVYAARNEAGRWNFATLIRKKEGFVPLLLPRLSGEITLRGASLEIIPSPGRVMHGRVREGRAAVSMGLRSVAFRVTRLQGALDEAPEWQLEDFSLEGSASRETGGWNIRLDSGRLALPCCHAELREGFYEGVNSEWSLSFSSMRVAPDFLELVWPGHPVTVPVEGSLALRHEPDVRLSFDADVHSAHAGAVRVKGSWRYAEKALGMEARMENLAPAAWTGRGYFFDRVTGTFYMTRRGGARPRMNMRLALSSFAREHLRSFPALVEMEMEGTHFRGTASSQSPGARMQLRFEGENRPPRPLHVQGEFAELDLGVFELPALRGSAAGKAVFDGAGETLDGLHGKGSLHVTSARVWDMEIQDASCAYDWTAGRLKMDGVRGASRGARFSGQGWLEPLAESLPWECRLRVEPESGARWDYAPAAGLALESPSLSLTLKGERERWRASASAKAAQTSTDYAVASSSSLQAEISGEGPQRLTGHFTLAAQGVAVTSGVPESLRPAPFALSLDAEFLPPGRGAENPAAFSLRTDGPDTSLRAKGTFEHKTEAPSWALALESLQAHTWGENWSLAAPVHFTHDAGGLRADALSVSTESGALKARGLLWGQVLDMNLSLSGMDLQRWGPRLFPHYPLRGTLDAEASLSGPLSAPEVLGSLRVDKPRYGTFAMDRLEGRFEQRPERLSFSLKGESEKFGGFSAGGTFPFRLSLSPFAAGAAPGGPMDIQLQAEEMACRQLLGHVDWMKDVGGSFSASARLMGTPETPVWSGRAELRDGRLGMPQWGIFLEDISGGADIERNRVVIPGLEGRSGKEGRVTLKGELGLAGFSFSTMDLSLAATRVRTANIPDLQAEMDLNLHAGGSVAAPAVSGRAVFSELTYRPPLLFSYRDAWEAEDPTINVRRAPKPGAAAPEPEDGEPAPSWLDRSRMDIALEARDTAQVANREIRLRFGGGIQVRKEPGGLFTLHGRVESREGWVHFRGKPFRVEQAAFAFPGIPVVDPDVDILASYQTPDYQTFIKISHTLSSPVVEFSSNPPLEPSDVLAVILFGRPASELQEGQQHSLAETGNQLAAGIAATSVSQPLAEAVNLDVLILSPGTTLETSAVGAGKYLNEKLYLFYLHRFGAEAAQEFRLRYQLHPRLFLETGQDQTGQGGVDLYFSKRY